MKHASLNGEYFADARSELGGNVRLIVQPDDGMAPILTAVKQARKSIDVMIFRFDRPQLEHALAAAVARGVAVRALIAHTSSDGARPLRALELRLLAAGLTVARTDDDLVRYHGKFMIVDRSRLFVLGFNFTAVDTGRSRSFGVEVRTKAIIRGAVALFEADAGRQPVSSIHRDLVVSPENSRERLESFIRGARRQLLIYDPKLSDPRMINLIHDRMRAGVLVRVLGRVAKAGSEIPMKRLAGARLHVRAIVRDGRAAFLGSQSLKRLELDKRRELGIVVHNTKVVRQMTEVFESDWTEAVAVKKAAKAVKKVQKRLEDAVPQAAQV
jgi:phosphatidylserine/phosphatidylglycerophosphate/cardiolipin synthase-like enzyme